MARSRLAARQAGICTDMGGRGPDRKHGLCADLAAMGWKERLRGDSKNRRPAPGPKSVQQTRAGMCAGNGPSVWCDAGHGGACCDP